MAKSGKNQGRKAPAQQVAKRAAVIVDAMSPAQRIAWISLHLLVFVTPLIIANWTWLGFRLPFTYDQFDIMKVLSQRVFTLIALGAWSWDIFTRGGKLRRTKIDYAILALLAWVLLTTFTSISPATAFFGKYRRFEGFLAFANYAAIFFLVTQFADRASRIRSLARTLFFSGTLVSFYGLLQYVGMDPIKWGTLPFEANRAFSTYGNPDLLGGFIIFPLAISLALALSEEKIAWRATYWVGFLITIACWIVAFTRGAWIGGVVAFAIIGVVAYLHRVQMKGQDWGFVGAGAAAAAALVVKSLSAPSDVMNVWLRLRSIFETNAGSSKTRFEIWQAAIDAIKARPVFGFGADTFRLVFPKYKPAMYVKDAGYLSVADNVHDYPLQITTALGIPGFLLLYGTIGAAAWFSAPLVFRRHEGTERLVLAGFWAACAGYMTHLMFGLSVTGSTFLLWLSMAVVLAPIARVVEIKPPSWGTYVGAVVLIVVAALVVGSFVYTVADNHYLKARLVTQGDARVAEVQKAIELNPYNDMYRTELGLAYVDQAVSAVTQYASSGSDPASRQLAQGYFDKAETALKDAIKFVPTEYDNYVFLVNLYNLGAAYLDPAYADQGIEWGKKGIEVEPYGPAIRFQLARAYMAKGENASAEEQLQTAVDRDSNYADAWALLGEVQKDRGEFAAAVESLGKALALQPAIPGLQASLDDAKASLAASATTGTP